MSTRAGLRRRLEALRAAIEPSCTYIKIEGGLPPPDEATEGRHFTSDELVTSVEGRRLLEEMRTRSATTKGALKPGDLKPV
jgi:hypothetical protein